MPAKSQAQRAYLNAHFGHAWTKEHHFDNKGKLPAHVKGSMKEHKGGHTGKIVHEDMKTHTGTDGLGNMDQEASSEYKAANKKHGIHAGMSPKRGCKGAPSESENEEYC